MNAEPNESAPPPASSLPAAVPVRRRRLPLAWLLPIVGLGIVAYFAYWAYTQNEPNVQLRLANASGIKAFQTPVVCRGVEVGTVTDVTLDATGRGATVSIRLDPSGLPLATPDSEWWVIRPEFSLTDIRGVESLLAGPSIEYRPGQEAPTRRKQFTGLSGPPPEAGMTGGLRIFLTADQRGSIEPGTPVRFRGVPIGRVISMRLPTHGQTVVFIAEIDQPFAHLVRDNSSFWNQKRAVAKITRVALGLDGYQIDFPRLNSALMISIDVATPDGPGTPIKDDAVFAISQSPPNDHEQWAPDLTPPGSRPTPGNNDTSQSGRNSTSDSSNPTDTPKDLDQPKTQEEKADPIGDLFKFINPFD